MDGASSSSPGTAAMLLASIATAARPVLPELPTSSREVSSSSAEAACGLKRRGSPCGLKSRGPSPPPGGSVPALDNYAGPRRACCGGRLPGWEKTRRFECGEMGIKVERVRWRQGSCTCAPNTEEVREKEFREPPRGTAESESD